MKKKPKKVVETLPTLTKEVNMTRLGTKRISMKRFVVWFKDKYFPARSVLVNMELMNGMHKTWIVIENKGGFIYRGSKYILDSDVKYYNLNAKLYCYDFHEALSIPIKRVIPVKEIIQSVDESSLTEVESALNPSTLQKFIESRIAEGVLKGQQIDDFIRQMRIIMIIILIVGLIHLALFVHGSGMLNDLKMPF